MKNISIDSYSFHQLLYDGKMDIFHFLETVKYRYDINAVGIWNAFLSNTDEEYLRKVKEALDEKDMVVSNIAVDKASIWDDDPKIRELNHKNALAHLRAAEILNAKSVRIDWGVRETVFTDAQFEFIVRRYKKYCKIASDNGFTVGPENHFGASLNPHLMIDIVNAVDHPAYKILVHLGRWNVDEKKGDEITASHAMHTHLSKKISEENLEKKLKIFIEAGYQGFWGIECSSGKDEYTQAGNVVESIKRALNNILQ